MIKSLSVHNLKKTLMIFSIVFLGVLGPLMAPYDPYQVVGKPYQGISLSHLLGTDGLGRDILSQVLVGSRITLFVSISSAILCLLISLVVGLISSLKIFVSQIISGIVDSFVAIPPFFIMIFLGIILGPSLPSEVLAIALSYWPLIAKSYRAEILSLFERGYVESSVALGASILWIIRKHVIPNMAHLTLANFTYLVGVSIVSEAILSFLGLSDQRYFSWGTIFYYAYIQGAVYYGLWQWLLAPAIIITIVAYMMFEVSKDILIKQ